MQTITDQVVLVVEKCCNCGTPFGMEETLRKNRLQHGGMFYCPNGHPQHYTDPIEAKLKRAEQALEYARDNAKWWKEEAEAKAKSLAATKGHLTRTKKRIANGVCPCCHRQFINLQRHMNTKHPEYASADAR